MSTTDSTDVFCLERPAGLSDGGKAWATLKEAVVAYLDAACDPVVRMPAHLHSEGAPR
jgi:hypothetical protein